MIRQKTQCFYCYVPVVPTLSQQRSETFPLFSLVCPNVPTFPPITPSTKKTSGTKENGGNRVGANRKPYGRWDVGTDHPSTATKQVYHQALTDHRAISTGNKSTLPRPSAIKFLSSSRPIHETRSSDVLGAFNVKRFIEVLAIGVETVACMGPISHVRQGAFSFALKFFESRNFFQSRFASRNFFFANFCRSVGRSVHDGSSPGCPKNPHTRCFFERNLA
jgi:hypothetical protein